MTTTSTSPETRPTPTGSWRRHLRALLVIGLIGGLIIGTLLGLTVGPKTPALGEGSTGDPALVADVRAVLVNDRGYDTLSVGRVRGGQVSLRRPRNHRGRRPAQPRRPRTSWARSPRPSPACCSPMPCSAARWRWRTRCRST